MQNSSNYQQLFNLSKDLIAFKSITPSDAGCLEYIQNYLATLGFTFTRLDRNKTSNLIATYGNLKAATSVFAFAGHVDVVPTGDGLKWKHNPFTLVEEDNLLYGRGIGDMKGAIAAFLVACSSYISNTNIPQDNAIMILLTSDEEGSGVDGMPVIVDYLKQNSINLKYCIVGEPTSINTIGDTVKIGRRGSLNCHAEIIGKQGHVAYPSLAINPIHNFSKVLDELITTSWDNGNQYFPPTQLQITNINSGLGVDNVIPYNLHVRFNLRYNNLHTAESLEKKITQLFDKHQLKYNTSWINSAQPFISTQGKLSKVVAEAIKRETAIDTQFSTDGGTSDARILIAVSSEILELGLTNQSIHQINEYIHKDELVSLSNIYYDIIAGSLTR
jgi:succinyl-diaminopimelate desuccinylase